MKTFYLAVFLLSLTSYVTGKMNIGDMVAICDAEDPGLNDCFVRAANQILPFLVDGIEELDIPPMDPFKIDKMEVVQSSGPVNVKFTLYDSVQTGLSTTVFDSAAVDLKSKVIVLNATIPYYNVKGRYLGKGRVLMFPISGDGKANIMFNNTRVSVRVEMETFDGGDDKTFFKMKNLKVAYRWGPVRISLSSLVGDNKRLNDAANKYINKNSDALIADLEGPLTAKYSKVFTDVIEKFLDNIPAEELFLNLPSSYGRS